MGQLAPGAGEQSDQRPVRRHARRQELDQAARGVVRRAVATANEGQDAHPLSRERGQSATVSARAARPSGEHRLARYRRWQCEPEPWLDLDNHSALPGKCHVL